MKKFLPDLIAILAFIVISFIYFFPAITEDRILFQHDTVAGAGAGQEAKEYYERTGERTRWTNALFGGMPTYQMSPSYDSTEPLTFVQKYITFSSELRMAHIYHDARVLYPAKGIRHTGMARRVRRNHLGIFVLFLHSDSCRTYLEIYYFSLYSTYDSRYSTCLPKKYLLGGIITALFMAMQILSNHVQMTYYFLFVILFMVGAFFEDAWRKKNSPNSSKLPAC